jgi:hypothetical protein
VPAGGGGEEAEARARLGAPVEPDGRGTRDILRPSGSTGAPSRARPAVSRRVALARGLEPARRADRQLGGVAEPKRALGIRAPREQLSGLRERTLCGIIHEHAPHNAQGHAHLVVVAEYDRDHAAVLQVRQYLRSGVGDVFQGAHQHERGRAGRVCDEIEEVRRDLRRIRSMRNARYISGRTCVICTDGGGLMYSS